MRYTTWRLALSAVLALTGPASLSRAQQPAAKDLVKAELRTDTTAIQPGKPFTVGVVLKMAPGWHVYWTNPGDSGMPTTVTFDLPAGFTASDVFYPAPVKFEQPGDFLAYGYADRVVLTATVTPPADLPMSGSIPIRASARYLVCEKVCLPGSTDMSVVLPVGTGAAPANQDLFSKARAGVPVTGAAADEVAEVKVDGRLAATGNPAAFTVTVDWKMSPAGVEFFPGPSSAIAVRDVTVSHEGKRSEIAFVVELLAGQEPDVASLDSVIAYTDAGGVRRGVGVAIPVGKPAGAAAAATSLEK